MNDLKHHIDNFVTRLQSQDVNMHGFILSVAGEEKAKAYYAPFKEGKPHRMYSVSKTLTGIAIGMLADEGKLKLTDPIVKYFPDYLPPNPHPWLLEQTIVDMLRMATCHSHTTYKEGIDQNWAATFFTTPPDHPSGTIFNYDTSCSQVLAALVSRLSGQQVIDFLQDKLFRPIGANDEKYWLKDPSGICQGGTGLCMTLTDLHKIAQCILDGGHGLIPAWYVQQMGAKQIDTTLRPAQEERYGYGWQCWRTRAGFSLYGMGGQLAIICPENRAILTTIADTRLDPFGVQRIYDAFFDELYPYLGHCDMSPITLTLATPSVASSFAPPFSQSPTYYFPTNPLSLKSLQLINNKLHYENNLGHIELPYTLGKNIETAYPGHSEVPALTSAGWVSSDTLHIHCYAIGDSPCGFEMILHFTSHSVTIQSRCSADPLTSTYNGLATGIAN